MNKQKKNRFQRAAALVLAAVMLLGLAGCGGGENNTDQVADDRTVIYYAASYVTAELQEVYAEMVSTYNENQGVTDGVYVQMTPESSAISGLDSALRANYQYDVLQLMDDEFKTLALQGKNYFVPMDSYLTEEAKTAMHWDDIPESLVNRFRMDTTSADGRLYMAGAGTELLAVPNGSDPQVLFYNKTILESCGINVISVPETELEAYNSANSAALMPHGYAEYKDAPYADAKSSRNEAGEFVYKVFNECIAMNWEELHCLARAFQQQYAYSYGYMSEWWFNYGFSVGGDCIGWDETAGQYLFTLTDKQAGYLALADITVNGSAYAAGQVLRYEDKAYLNSNASELQALSGQVYELPSMYDAILEFTRLGVPADKQADTGVYGYGVAPSTTANRDQKFLSGSDCPLLVEDFSKIHSYKGVLGDSLGMAMPAQYRQYVGGSTYEKDGKEYLKVIGQTYDGEVYTGQLHYENDVAIVGEAATESSATGFFMPANTKNKNYDAAFKFITWAAGPEGQAILAKGNTAVPNQTSYGLGEYAESSDRLIPNMWAGAYLAQQADIGDYTYFTTETWIAEWSLLFNNDVRKGEVTISDFIAQKQEVADNSLRTMRLRMLGR